MKDQFDTTDPQIEFAIESVKEVSLLVSRIQEEMVSSAITKDDRSPVTVADFSSQALIGSRLARARPGDILVGEEDSTALQEGGTEEQQRQVHRYVENAAPGASLQDVLDWIDLGAGKPGDRYWTLDPIDGTKGFLRGDQYVVALALVENGEVQIGVLGCPNLEKGKKPNPGGRGSILAAVKDRGCWVAPLFEGGEFERVQVSDCQDPNLARVLRSFESGHTDVSLIERFGEQLGISVDPVRMDSQAKYSLLSAGAGELMLRLLSPNQMDYREKIWDRAAGLICLQEAGGTVTDLDGKALDFTQGRRLESNRGVLASNGYLHDAALEALRWIGA